MNFDAQFEQDLKKIQDIVIRKGREYRRENNPFHNFEKGANISNQHPALVLDGFMLKHYISYRDILNDLKQGIHQSDALIEEKIFDMIIYLLIQKQLLTQQ